MKDSNYVANVVDINNAKKNVSVTVPNTKQTTKSSHRGWAGLTPVEAERPGSVLLKLIYEEGFKRGLQISDIAAEIGVSYGYMAQLRNGLRSIPNISDEILQKIANFLQVPKFTVLLAAEKIELSDFYEPTTLEHSIEVALVDMSLDIEWAGIIPASLADSDSKIKLLTIRLYEEATGKKLMPFQIFPDDIAEFV